MPRTIVFAHANGFPAGTYRQVFDVWRQAGWTVMAPEMLGHDPAYPVSGNWSRLRDQLADFIRAHASQPVALVGHSLGGLLSLLVACRRPDLVSSVVMLDSPVVIGWRAHSVRMLKASGLMQRFSPGRVSRGRRYEWPTRQAALAHFSAKPTFARWAPGVLHDYISAGTRSTSGRTVLAFDRMIETRIYDTVPHHFPRLLGRHPPRCPVGFIAGTRSQEMRLGGMDGSRRLAGERFRWIEGTHLYPMERPEQTAALVLELLDGMGLPAAQAPAAPQGRPGAPAAQTRPV